MATNDLIGSKDETLLVDEGYSGDLQALAERKATEILQNIEESNARIAEANDAAEKADAMGTGFLGTKTRKKTDATAKALLVTNKAVSEMNNLIQESVRFTCTSIQFAQVMHKTMAYMIAQGFKARDGNITRLAGNSKKIAQQILDEADDFVKKQLKVEKQIGESRRDIDINAKQIGDNKVIIAIHTQQIEYLQRKFRENEQLDKEQNAIIEKNAKELKSNVVLKRLTFAFGIAAIVISIVSLVFMLLWR